MFLGGQIRIFSAKNCENQIGLENYQNNYINTLCDHYILIAHVLLINNIDVGTLTCDLEGHCKVTYAAL